MSDKTYAIAAQFDSAKDLFHAAEKVRDKGYQSWDVHSPFPIHGMDEAMGLKRSRVSLFSLIGGCCGCLTALFLVYYTGKIDYPLIVHGKPYFAFEPCFPIFFELTILITAFFTVGSMFVLNLMPRFNHPVFNWDKFAQATDDGFFVVIEAKDPRFQSEQVTENFLKEIGGKNVSRIEE